MKFKSLSVTLLGLIAFAGGATATFAQGSVTLPPSGGNQKASVIQHIGLVEVRIDYSSPDVTGPQGEDRRGRIWGQLVPYGLTNLGFGNGNPGPWRAGANENTVFTVSHDVLVQGKPLPAGAYGLHMIAGESDWSIVFSSNSSSWGSFFYDDTEDVLRVGTKAEKAPYREWLTYEFLDRGQDSATVALEWEELRVPFTISVPNQVDLYVANMRDELRSTAGFGWQGFNAAVQYCLQNNVNLEEALVWAETAISAPFIGQENFTTLQSKAQVFQALNRADEGKTVMAKAMRHATATAAQIHTYGRQLQAGGDTAGAVAVYKLNHERYGEVWPVAVGMARALSHEGKFKKALEYARLARSQAPDPLNQGNLDAAIGLLEQGKDFNLTN